MSKAKNSILILENEENIIAILGAIFSRNQTPFIHADNVNEARLIVERRTIKLALVEVFLKGESLEDGLELIRFIRRKNPLTKIIVLTRCTSSNILAAVKEAGVNNIFLKPADIKDVVSTINEFGIPVIL